MTQIAEPGDAAGITVDFTPSYEGGESAAAARVTARLLPGVAEGGCAEPHARSPILEEYVQYMGTDLGLSRNGVIWANILWAGAEGYIAAIENPFLMPRSLREDIVRAHSLRFGRRPRPMHTSEMVPGTDTWKAGLEFFFHEVSQGRAHRLEFVVPEAGHALKDERVLAELVRCGWPKATRLAGPALVTYAKREVGPPVALRFVPLPDYLSRRGIPVRSSVGALLVAAWYEGGFPPWHHWHTADPVVDGDAPRQGWRTGDVVAELERARRAVADRRA